MIITTNCGKNAKTMEIATHLGNNATNSGNRKL